ncbi:MAG: hypothetical protein WD070_09920, partial [Pirellulaceae bacterium]
MSNGLTMRIVVVVGIVAACATLAVERHRPASHRAASRQASDSPDALPTQRADVCAGRRARPEVIELIRRDGTSNSVRLCQGGMMLGVDCNGCEAGCREPRWEASRPIPWEVFAQGDYVGPARTRHVTEYALRVNDIIEFVYWFTLEARDEAYRFEVGDEIMVESFSDASLNRGSLDLGRGLVIQPDGTITLPLL